MKRADLRGVFGLRKSFLSLGILTWSLFGINPAAAQTQDPTLTEQVNNTFSADAFQTDLFMGASTAQIPIQVPSAAGGVAPKITLRYSSSSVDEIKASQQGSWAGLGWVLETGGFVLHVMGETPSDDSYRLIFGGASYDLIKNGSDYHTKDESFLKVHYFNGGSDNYWVVTTKDGLQHRFGLTAESRQKGISADFQNSVIWRWYLDEVKTTSGVSITYSYDKVTTTATWMGDTKPYDQAVYLKEIKYAYRNGIPVGPERVIKFNRTGRPDWKDTSGSTIISLHEKQRLDSIEVLQNNAPVRKYVFVMDNSIDRDPDDRYWKDGTVGDLTLKSLNIFGADGITQLPSPSFAYNSWGYLETANNGLGGNVSYTYERIRNVYLNSNQVDEDCGPENYLHGDLQGCSSSQYAYILRDPAPNTIPLYRNQLEDGNGSCRQWWELNTVPHTCGDVEIYGYAWKTQTVDSVAINRVWAEDGEGGGGCGDSWLGKGGTCDLQFVAYARSGGVDYVAKDGGNWVDHVRGRVTSRTVSDGLGWSSMTKFISYYPNYGDAYLGFQEFRGYGQVRSIDPLGNYTDTFFRQDDDKKGRIDKVEVRNSAGALIAKTDNTWVVKTPFTSNLIKVVLLSRVDKYKCDAQPTCFQTAQTFTYDNLNGNPLQTASLGDVAIVGDERTETTDWSVDTNWIHRPIQITLKDAAGAVVRERWLTYDTRGLLTKEENRLLGPKGTAGNPTVTYAYDVFGNRTSTTDPLGCTTTTVYESSQTYPEKVTTCLSHETVFTYDTRFGVITSQRDPNLQTTTSAYDVFGRLIKKTGPLAGTSAYGSVSKFYLDFGTPNLQRIATYTTEEHGTSNVLVTEQFFDGLGRQDHTETDAPEGKIIATDVTFDIRGNVEKKSMPYFISPQGAPLETIFWTRFDYDVIGRQTKVTHPDGTFATTAYLKDVVTQTDENGNIKRRFIDAYDRIKKIEEVDGAATYTTTYAYDVEGSLIHVQNHLGHNTRIKYDLMGRKIAMCDPNMGAGPNTTACDTNTPGAWIYTYDNAGNLKTQKDAKSQTLYFDYDLQSRMARKTYPGGQQINWTYDISDLPDVNFPKGRLTKVIDLATETRLVYDKEGRVIKTERKIGGMPYVMTEQYNALGKVISEKFPDGETVNYTYDAGALAAIPGYIDHTSCLPNCITYNARGQKKTIKYANGVTSNFTYNETGTAPDFRLTNRNTAGSVVTFQNLTYDYDNVGNITSITDPIFTADRTFTYDRLNRLSAASGDFGAPVGGIPGPASCTYTYNAIGNITNKCNIAYSYNDPNHPSFVTNTSDGKTYTADANGNTASGAGRTFAWTPDNRVASVTMGSTASMDYDYTGIRIKKTSGTFVTLYPFAGYEIGPDGVISKFFKIGNEILAARKGTNEKLFYHNDHLGGINVITKLDGTRSQLTEYDPWGKVSRQEGNADPSHRFTGQELDPESGLYYYAGRYYDSQLGRFISPDMMIPKPDDPQSLNRYSYSINNPQRYIDPSGHSFWDFFKQIFNFARVIVAVLFVEVAPEYTILEIASVATSYSDSKKAGMASNILGYMAQASQVGRALYDRLITGRDVGPLVDTKTEEALATQTTKGATGYSVNGVLNFNEKSAAQVANASGMPVSRLIRTSGPLADLVKAGLAKLGITGVAGEVIAADLKDALPTLSAVSGHSAGAALLSSVLSRAEFAGLFQGVSVNLHAPIVSPAFAKAIESHTGATVSWHGSLLDTFTYLGRPIYMAPVGIMLAPLIPFVHPCAVSCPMP